MPRGPVKYQIGLLRCGPVSGAHLDLFGSKPAVSFERLKGLDDWPW